MARSAASRDRDEPDPGFPTKEMRGMKAFKIVATALGILVAAAVVIPLVVLAGLFIWLKLTEESDEEALELEQEGA
jgi:hypothetical protein